MDSGYGAGAGRSAAGVLRTNGGVCMKILGITGPTGAGKTTALNVLTSLGACILDADAVYHDLLEQSRALREALTARSWAVWCSPTLRLWRT